jgi:uroporphyrinogen-III decarboxylase
MTTVLHPETCFSWMMEEPDLMTRFRDILSIKLVELNQALRAFSKAPDPGWWITDDNCALFSPGLYRTYCVPVLRAVLEAMAPGGARRYQHSDSAMAHLLDDQRQLGINAVNYGPDIDLALIRAMMPDAQIQGHTPPFLLRNSSPDAIRERVVSDFHKAGAGGRLVVTTAGSLAAGTGVGRMRWMMKLVRDLCRYDLCR